MLEGVHRRRNFLGDALADKRSTTLAMMLLPRPAGREKESVFGDGVPQLGHAFVTRCGREEHLHGPWAKWPEVQHRPKIPSRPVGAGEVGLVDHEDVRHLEQTGL